MAKKTTKKVEAKQSDRTLKFSELQSLLARMPLNPRQTQQIVSIVKAEMEKVSVAQDVYKRLNMLAAAMGMEWRDETLRRVGWFKRTAKNLWP